MSEQPCGFLARGTWTPALVTHERLELANGVDAPAHARELARASLAPHLPAVRRNDLLVLVTELVTNAVRHAAPSPVVVHLAAAERVVRVEVCDDGPGFEPVEREPGPDGGFGLILLRTLSDRWGIATDDGTCVWFELAL
jgi:signal transduction histidine kinase